MTFPSWALQKAIYQRLAADADLVSLLGAPRIYDDVPRHADFPYLTLGTIAAADWSSDASAGSEHELTVHVWSRGGGKKQAFAILEAARNALHEADLVLDGHHLVSLRCEFAEVRDDPDRLTRHGVLRLRAVTETAI